jgi:hypothetical protein
MTLVQASIADDGNSVVLIADRLLTRRLSRDLPSYEFESATPKILFRGNVGIGFAGLSLYAEISTRSLNKEKDFDKITGIISKCVRHEREKFIEGEVRILTGVSAKEFFTNPQLAIPPEVRESIYGMMGEFDIECNAVVAGFDKNNKARIAVVDEDGDIVEVTPFGFASIGTGSPFSIVYFDQHGYDTRMKRNEAIVFAFEAKKWAEAHTGVGDRTDILVFDKGKKPISIYDDNEKMKQLRNAYEVELKKHRQMRVALYQKVFKN